MKQFAVAIILIISFFSCSSSQKTTSSTKYFGIDGNEISESKFKRERTRNRKYIGTYADSLDQKRIALREETGRIDNRNHLDSILEKQTNIKIDKNKSIVIVFYPGKDQCNSSGSATKASLALWFNELENRLSEISKVKPIYIYKSKIGLERYNGVLTWHKDPNRIIEKSFFKFHYPCSSFVVISKTGEYISYFGEFGKDYLWKAAEILEKTNN
ncbi:MAG: hypothetical protein QNK89_10045 [Lacinutrix sp.]|uniref:hypothetical protein n=1 Tax=Lacinutrix sp. TaxID=1937692 RepID=UPI0030AE44D8